jgi:UDP-3-O-acyl-N-acetylglucosamine deacetylase
MKDPQKTLRKPVYIRGKEPFGGCDVELTLKPSDVYTGISFELPDRKRIPAALEYATATGFTTALSYNGSRVLIPEHILATLYASGIDNATVQVRRIPSKSLECLEKLGLATKNQVIPYFPPENELTLYKKIQEAGLAEQNAPRRKLRLERTIITEEEKLIFQPIPSEEFVMTVKTNYPKIGEQTATMRITPENYEKISAARAYMKHIPTWANEDVTQAIGGLFIYPQYGFGTGMSTEVNFRQTKTAQEWKSQERMPGEVAHHTIIDKLGAIALLPGRLNGVHIKCNRSGHTHDIQTLKKYKHLFKPED